ncbi:hypothetical protein SCRM01_295 [Synechococcus phage S-CRM01]|nr:hypothetical protein SCRM01_295 [Synechococcus phage S-CRM01]AEC53241.1 hypothetical protein SCRM01_295 [Synechococcus phage S-CRM01]
MARIFSKNGSVEIQPTQKKTAQGNSKNTKFSAKSNSHRSKKDRGQGK